MIRGGFAGWDGGETVDSRRGGGTASQPEQEIVALASRAALTNTARPICRKQTYSPFFSEIQEKGLVVHTDTF